MKVPKKVLGLFVFLVILFVVFPLWVRFRSHRPLPTPNVVLIIIDTLRADALGCYGAKDEVSPELDALARQGVRFENVWAQSSWTRPSIASLLTSQYPRELGIYKEQDDALSQRSMTLPKVLKQHGFNTIGVTANPNINSTFGFAEGFDTYTDSHVVWPFMKTDETLLYSEVSRLSSAKKILDAALSSIQSRNARTPTYLQINLMDVHERPESVEQKYRTLFLETSANPAYAQAVRQVSIDVRNFLDRLLALDGWKDTLIIVTSDHGEGLSDHDCLANSSSHGYLLYRSQLSVPWIMWRGSDPDFAGKIIKTKVDLLDFAPTVLDYLGIPQPTEFRGLSRIPLLRQDPPEVEFERPSFAETNWREVNKVAVIEGNWLLIKNYDRWNGSNLWELQSIAGSQNGMCTDLLAAHPEVFSRLEPFLSTWEKVVPRQSATKMQQHLANDEVMQLKSLGYLQ